MKFILEVPSSPFISPFFFCVAPHCLTQSHHFSMFSHPLLDLLMALIARSLLGLEICHGRRSLVGCSPWGQEESDTTDQLHFHFSLSCIGEGNGNPLQCSCLENPRDEGAWWAAIYGVAKSRTRLK